MWRTRWALLVAGAVLTVLVSAAPAGAAVNVFQADVSQAGPSLFVSGLADNDRNRLLIEHFSDSSRNGTRVRQLGFGDPTISSDDPNCQTNRVFNDVVCTPFPVDITVNSGPADNEVVIGGSSVDCQPTTGTPVVVDLQDGNDILRAGATCGGQPAAPASGAKLLHPIFDAFGGSGNDDMSGGGLNDILRGGPGDDVLHGERGNDSLRGDSGADLLDGDSGNDLVTYAERTSSLTVTLDGVANDGAAGEGDNLVQIEGVIGGSGADDITGSAAGNRLIGGAGGDELTGGGGLDALRGGRGNDLIDSRDGVTETVDCGAGTDEAILDLEDSTVRVGRTGSSTCETVQRFAIDDAPPGRVLGRSVRVGRDGSLRLRLSCPRRARVTCRGALRLTHAGRGRRILAKTRYTVRRGRTRSVRLRLPRREAARALARRAIVAATVERGVSRKGPRRTERHLRAVRKRGAR